MESEHIKSNKLYQAVAEEMVLEPTEIEHLRNCDECLEVIRNLVRRLASNRASLFKPVQ